MKLLKLALFAAMMCSPAMAQHQVTLNWQAPPDWVTGDTYVVERANTPGGEAINVYVGITTVTTFVDVNVAPAQTYYYTVVHVRQSDGMASAKSNEVTATIPVAPPTNVKVGGTN